MKHQVWLFLVMVLVTLPAFSQACNPPAGQQYNNQFPPWQQSQQVFMSTDSTGAGTNGNVLVDGIEIAPDPSNPAPKFTLDTMASGQSLSQTFENGAMGWNVHDITNGTGITFQQGSTLNTGNWIVSPTWPKATVQYLDSNGTVRTAAVDFSNKPGAVAATTISTRLRCSWPPYDQRGSRCHIVQYQWHIQCTRYRNLSDV
jgi:hypothetical protein